jgi:BirA family biotin operon repressor/biotin-[acetyl-CoA-carboxylase] ligase
VAVTDVLAEWGVPASGDGRRGIKWVNDILVAGAKLGGVLTSARSQDGRLRSAVLGIGLNVLAAPEVSPTPFTPAVTCLADHLPPADVSVGEIAAAVLRAVARRFEQLQTEGRGPLLEAYRRESLVLGRRVTVQAAGPEGSSARTGRVLEIRPDLGLVLSDDPHPVSDGRLILEPDHLP